MDRDAIIREWFYRLPKGYATAPYSKQEMNVLHEILEENGLNGSIFVKEDFQLDQAFHEAEPVKDEVEEILLIVSNFREFCLFITLLFLLYFLEPLDDNKYSLQLRSLLLCSYQA